MPRHSPEAKAAAKFIESINTLDFRPNVFAVCLGMANITIQRRVLETFMLTVDYLADRYEDMHEHLSADEVQISMEAKRMQDAMEPFRR